MLLRIIFLTITLAFNSIYANDSSTVLKRNLKALKNSYLETHNLNSIYAVFHNNTTLLKGAHGYYSYKEDNGIRDMMLCSEQKMPIASGTKQMTAAAILRLKDQGKLSLSSPISSYLPAQSHYWNGAMPEWANNVTIHHLLTHTSGVVEYLFALQLDLTQPHEKINTEIISLANKSPLAFVPGEKFSYCNTGYVILGLIIEEISGKKLAQYFKDEFFDVLKMNNTHLSDIKEAFEYQSGKLRDIYPDRYLWIPTPNGIVRKIVDGSHKLPPFADGGVVSTAEDMHKWMSALYQGKILSPESLTLMVTPHIKAVNKSFENAHYGYGIFILKENGNNIYLHGGNAIGIRGEYGYIKEKNISVILMSNHMMHIPEEMASYVNFTLPEHQLDIVFFNKALLSLLCK